MNSTVSRDLAVFLENSPTCFHAVDNMKKALLDEHFTQLEENRKWILQPGGFLSPG